MSDLIFSQTSPDKIFLNKLIIFYDITPTFGWFEDTDMFIRCIISLTNIRSLLTEVNCVKISMFSENINHDRTTFFPAESLFFTIFTLLKWNGGPGWITIIFNVHWGILGAIVSISPIARLVFKSLFVLKSWLSCFRGTATYLFKVALSKDVHLQSWFLL